MLLNVLGRLGREGDRVEVVHNFIDLNKFDLKKFDTIAEKVALGYNQNDRIVLCVTNLGARKGLLELARTLDYLTAGVKVLVVGVSKKDLEKKNNDRYQQKVGATLNASHNQNRINFAGYQEEMIKYFAAADILVVPWTSPHSARPIFEAWAMHKPVVAFDIAGIRETVSDGKDGILVSEKTGKALAEAINKLIVDEVNMLRIGESGYKKACLDYRQETNVKKIFDIYRQLTG